MGLGLVEGRDLSTADVTGAPDVVVINETLARRYFAGRSAMGGRITILGRTLEVVGIAKDGKYSSITERARSAVYVAVQQFYSPDAVLVLRTSRCCWPRSAVTG